jgi:hypothetical protein
LGSGVCLFAYGPQQVASMQHLQKNECAIICNDKKQLKETLLTAFFDSNKRLETIDKALETAKKYHQQEKNSQEIYHMINRIKF